jgi:hypothetical protein
MPNLPIFLALYACNRNKKSTRGANIKGKKSSTTPFFFKPIFWKELKISHLITWKKKL